jgi:hypothetical protein
MSNLGIALVTAGLLGLWGLAWVPGAGAKDPSTEVNPKIPRLSDVQGEGDATLIQGLRKGGYVIFFRHCATDWGQRDVSYTDFQDRAGQRNLSEAGKAQAAAIGKAFQALGIPIDSVFSSPMWRCRDTADIAFGRCLVKMALFGKVSQVPPPAGGAPDRAQYRAERVQMLGAPPTPGKNRILVGQQDPMIPIIPGLHRDELREGDALVIQPLGKDKFKVVAQVTTADWERQAADFAGKGK